MYWVIFSTGGVRGWRLDLEGKQGMCVEKLRLLRHLTFEILILPWKMPCWGCLQMKKIVQKQSHTHYNCIHISGWTQCWLVGVWDGFGDGEQFTLHQSCLFIYDLLTIFCICNRFTRKVASKIRVLCSCERLSAIRCVYCAGEKQNVNCWKPRHTSRVVTLADRNPEIDKFRGR